jgi:hypothetical protein
MKTTNSKVSLSLFVEAKDPLFKGRESCDLRVVTRRYDLWALRTDMNSHLSHTHTHTHILSLSIYHYDCVEMRTADRAPASRARVSA